MSVKYKDNMYANDRLTGTIVRHNNTPIYIDRVSGDGWAYGHSLGGGVPKVIQVQQEELDLTPVPLGNVNELDSVLFVQRMPKRRDWRQGLRRSNMHVSTVVGLPRDVNLTGQGIVKTIMGVYPNVEECLEMVLCEEVLGRAFSRYFSVGSRLAKKRATLHFRDKGIGTVGYNVAGELSFEITQDYRFLNEFLQEELKIGRA